MRARFLSTLIVTGALALASCTCPPPPRSPATESESPAEPPAEPDPPAEPTPPAEPDPRTEPGPAEPAPAAGAQGQPCGENDACEDGLECVRYYGIAGKQGPEFTSCEIRCKNDADCPNDQACTQVSDGPGQVCREAERLN